MPGSSSELGGALARANTSSYERLVGSRLADFRAKAREVGLAYRAFRPAWPVIRAQADPRRFPVTTAVRGAQVTLRSPREAYLYARPSTGSEFVLEGIDHTEGSPPAYRFQRPGDGRRVTLVCPEGMGDPAIFLSGEYARLPVAGRDVVDVGAGAGETAVYFALRGARSVAAFEPFPESWKFALANVHANVSAVPVTVRREAVGDRPGERSLDASNRGALVPAGASEGATLTAETTLERLVGELGIQNGALKLDCEGDEYRILAATGRSTLRRFEYILLEYHYGARSIVEQLREAGFVVEVSGPIHYWRDPNPHLYCGRIWAFRG